MKKPIMAIMYDFDKTLSVQDMQNYDFIPALGMTPAEFWGATDSFAKKHGIEKILSYMYMMILKTREKGIDMTEEWLNSLGRNIKFYSGVTTWFHRINEYGLAHGLQVEHYLISSGTKEIVDGCSIAKEFKAIYGCQFLFDDKTKLPIWPKLAINYTQKTQYFFRVSKGAIDISEDAEVNAKTPNRRVPYKNMVYLGDGMTDVPIMILVRQNGGHSIAVYKPGEKDKVIDLFNDERVDYVCRADYSAGSPLESVLKLIIDSIYINNALDRKRETLSK